MILSPLASLRLTVAIFALSMFLILAGTLAQVYHGTWEMMHTYFRSFGVMCSMVASQQVTMSTLEPALVKNASGLLNLSRNVGGAIGLAALSSVVGQGTRAHVGDISARMNAADPQSQAMLGGLIQRMTDMGVADPAGAARKAMSFLVEKQAMTIAFGEAFGLLAILTVLVGFVALFTKRPPPLGRPVEMEAH